MSRRIRRKENAEQEVEAPIGIEEALNANVEVSIYDKFASIVNQYGSDLLLRVYSVKSDNRSLGFIDEIVGGEIDLFLGSPEVYLRDRFGHGIFRIIVFGNANKRIISNLTISISSPKNIPNTNTSIDVISEVSKARKEGRQEILELANLIKPTTTQTQQQQPIDLIALFKFLGDEQNKIRERELELKKEELAFLKETLNRNQNFNEQFKPMFDFMGSISGVFKNVMGVVDRSVQLAQDLSPVPEEPSLKGFLYEIGKNLLSSNPNFLKGIALPNPNIPNMTKNPITTNLPLDTNPTEIKTPKEELNPKGDIQANQFNFDFAFPVILSKYIKRATRNEDPSFCGDSLLADLEDLLEEKLISKSQLNQAYNLLLSDNLEVYIKNFFPDVVKYKAWIIDFQDTIKEGLTEPQEGESEPIKQ